MLKQTFAVACLSFAAVGMISLPTRAQQVQTSGQGSNQTAVINGNNNQINQYNIQVNVQKQRGRGYGKIKHQQQGSLQGTNQEATAVGVGNQINQTSQQLNVQQQTAHPRSHKHKHSHEHDDD